MNTGTTNLVPFQFEDHLVRIQTDEQGNPWFNANDVCGVLGYANPRKAIDDHVDPEDVTKRDTLTAGGTQQQNHLNESGVYALIFGSTLPTAKRFKRWVTAEVLPSIRKTGIYAIDQAHSTHTLPLAEYVGIMRRLAELESFRSETLHKQLEQARAILQKNPVHPPRAVAPTRKNPNGIPPLTPEYQIFIDHYLATGNATQAYRLMCGDNLPDKRKTINQHASRTKQRFIQWGYLPVGGGDRA